MLADVVGAQLARRRAARRTPAAAGRSARRRRRSPRRRRRRRASPARSSTSRGKTFSPPETIISSSRPSTNRRPSLVEVADVAGRHEAVDDRLAAAARCSPRRPARCGRGCGRARRARRPPDRRSSYRRTAVPRGAKPAVPGAARRSCRGRDRRPGDLRRAVEVVEHVAEVVHHARRERPGQRGAAGGDDAQRAEVVAADGAVAELEDPLQHHRRDDERRRAVLVDRAQRRLGIEVALQDERRRQRGTDQDVREAPRVKQRRRDQGALSRAQRDPRQQRRDRVQRGGAGADRSPRRPGRAAREDHDPARGGGRDELGGRGRLGELVEPRNAPAAAVRPIRPFDGRSIRSIRRSACVRAPNPPRRPRTPRRRRSRAACSRSQTSAICGAANDVLSSTRVGADLRARDGRLDQAAMVATQDRDAVARRRAPRRSTRARSRSCAAARRRTSASRGRRRSPSRPESGSPPRCSRRPASRPSA